MTSVAQVARFYGFGRAVLQMRTFEFFAWADVLPELMRRERVEAIDVRVIAGARGVDDSDYKRIRAEMSEPIEPWNRLAPEKLKKLREDVDELNDMIRRSGLC